MPGTRRFPRIALGLAAALTIAGCQGTAFLSGAGSMRIDVEVYKGPLSKDPNVQLGELVALTKEVEVAFKRYRAALVFHGAESRGACKILSASADTGTGASSYEPDPRNQFCFHLVEIARDVDQIVGKGQIVDSVISALGIQKTPTADLGTADLLKRDPESLAKTLRQAIAQVAEVSVRLKSKAFFWATATAASMPESVTVRALTSSFMVTAAEYANQMLTHADALLQQMAGANRRELPISVLLRETTPTQFLNTYVWNRAVAPALLFDQVTRPGSAFSSEETRDRVRVIERLYDDHHWARINTAFATGQGDTSMAFIKDDIGNWNLKSFDNDPSELLQAYRNLGFAGLQMATTAIRDLATPGGSGAAAASLLDTANRVALGRGSAPAQAGGVGIETLHRRALGRLTQMKTDAGREQEDLKKLLAERTIKKKAADDVLFAARKNVTDALARRPDGKSSEEHSKLAEGFEAKSREKRNAAKGRRSDAEASGTAADTVKRLRQEEQSLGDEADASDASAAKARENATKARAVEAEAEGIRIAEVVTADAAQKKAADDLAGTGRDIETLTARHVAEAVKLLEGHIDLIGLMEQAAAGAGGVAPQAGGSLAPAAARPPGY